MCKNVEMNSDHKLFPFHCSLRTIDIEYEQGNTLIPSDNETIVACLFVVPKLSMIWDLLCVYIEMTKLFDKFSKEKINQNHP